MFTKDYILWKTNISELHNQIETFYSNENKRIKYKYIDSPIDLSIPTSEKLLRDEYEEQKQQLAHYCQIYRRAIFCEICSYLHGYFYRRCVELQNNKKLVIAPDNLRGGEIEKYFLYIQYSENIDIKKTWPVLWKHIKVMGVFRNKFVHCNSYISSKDQDIIRFIKSNREMVSSKDNQIYLERTFVEYQLKKSTELIDKYETFISEKPI